MTPTKRDALATLVGLLVGVVLSFGGFKTMPTAFCEGAVQGAALVSDGGVSVAAVVAVVPGVIAVAGPVVVDAGLLNISMPVKPAAVVKAVAVDAGK
jgi:hypothetical protein